MPGDLPMIEKKLPIVVMKFPNRGFYLAAINNYIQGNNNLEFIQNGTTLIVNWTYTEETA